MRSKVVLFALLALLLAGCGTTATVPLEVARRRWESNLVEHYRLHVEHETGGVTCGQVTEVRLETFERLLSSTCADTLPWTVSALFIYAAWMKADDQLCVRQAPGGGCVCRAAVEVRGDYDPARGYPRELLIRYTWKPTWQEQSFWSYVAASWSLPDCTPPRGTFQRRISIVELRAI